MHIKDTVKKMLASVSGKRVAGKRRLTTSYVSLFLILCLLVTATFSWFTNKNTASIDTSLVTLSASSGLRVNNGEDFTGVVQLAKNVKLAEASSVDGRNMYFPTTGTFDDETENMVFREGNVGDKNVHYYYNDFSLNSDSGDTDVYVKSYEVKVTTTDKKQYVYNGSEKQTTEKCPLRIAFIQDSSDTPKVIDPTALLSEYAITYKSVSSTDSTGSPVISDSDSHSFMEYYFGHDPLFTLKDDTSLNLTMVIWLEGGDTASGKNNCDKFAGATVEMNIQLESNWDYMETVKFIDNTVGDTDTSVKHWINTDGCLVTMSYVDTDGQSKYVEMRKSKNYDTDYTWTAAIPQGVITNITFNRYNPAKQEVWNAWYTQENVNNMYPGQIRTGLQTTRIVQNAGKSYRSLVYEAKRGNGKGTDEATRMHPCEGYWLYTSESVPVDDTQVTVPSTAPTSATEGTTSEQSVNVTCNIYLNVKQWVYDDAVLYGYPMYIVLNDGNKNIEYQMQDVPTNRFSIQVTVPKNTKIVGFKSKNASKNDTKTFVLNSTVTMERNYNFTFNMNDDNSINVQ